MRDKLKYTHGSQDSDPVRVEQIPKEDLRIVLDDTHLKSRQEKEQTLK